MDGYLLEGTLTTIPPTRTSKLIDGIDLLKPHSMAWSIEKALYYKEVALALFSDVEGLSAKSEQLLFVAPYS